MSKVIFTFVTLGALPVSFPPIAARPANLSVLSAFMHKPGCDRFIPHYDSGNDANYDAWRGEHQSEIEEIER
jgi:hypothetical protein